jgi:hypothetical protein
VKRGTRIVHGDKELLEKLGRNDPCPCRSGRRFQELLHAVRPIRRHPPRPLLSADTKRRAARPGAPSNAGARAVAHDSSCNDPVNQESSMLAAGTLASRRLARLRPRCRMGGLHGCVVTTQTGGSCHLGSETQPSQPARTPALRPYHRVSRKLRPLPVLAVGQSAWRICERL